MSGSGFLQVHGRRIEYRQFPPQAAGRDQPVFVLLHEGLGSVAMWKDFPARLAATTGARVVAYSRFGYGRSDALPEPYAALAMHEREALEVLPEVLRQLRIERPVLFGHSDGASIALIHAGLAPQPPAGLVTLAPHVFVEDLCIQSIEAAKRTYMTTDMRSKLGRYHEDPDRAFWGWNTIWLDRTFRAWNIEHCLPSITCPVLAIQGHEDEYGTMEQLERIARGVPQAQLLRLGQCRHSPYRDQPDAVLESVRRWMQHPGMR